MPSRMYPEDYFMEQRLEVVETVPSWVPIIIGICVVLMGAVALYSLSLHKKNIRYEGD